MSALRTALARLALPAILLLAFALRVYHLDVQSLWYDEAVTARVVQDGLAELARWTADDIQPPLYYALLAGWTRLAGNGEWALRFPSAVFGLLLVPLAFVLGRRLFGRPAGMVTALLASVHPLWLYYSQEARMYTLLALLGMVAGYVVLRIVNQAGAVGEDYAGGGALRSLSDYTKARLGWWVAFVLAAVAMLYTHYFGAFLLLAFGLFYLAAVTLLQPANGRRLLVEGIAAALVVALAYLPWLPNALRRFQVDASYWQGSLKLNEAVRHLAISFTTGETVLEARATWLAWLVFGVAVVCLAGLAWKAMGREKGRGKGAEAIWTADGGAGNTVAQPADFHRPSANLPPSLSILFVLLYLLVPIVAILALSYRTPKFNPRYLMLASPALLLLLGGGLSLPFGRTWATTARFKLRASRALAALGLAMVLTIFLYADRNWFVDPAFTKDDWRGAVNYVNSQRIDDEAVVLVSGHAAPAWDYYAPEIAAIRLPEIEILDVNAVVDLEGAAAALNGGLAGKRGAWLLQWQDEVVDPTGVTPALLDMAGEHLPVDASFWGLDSPRHYRFPQPVGPEATRFAGKPPDDRALNANFANQVELIAFSQTGCDQPMCPLYLYWRALRPLDDDLKLTATLFEGDRPASPAVDSRLAAYEYPTFRWQPGGVVLGQLALTPYVGTQPGTDFAVRLGVYDDATGQALALLDEAANPQGPWLWLEDVAVNAPIMSGPVEASERSDALDYRPQLEMPTVETPMAVAFGEVIELAGIDGSVQAATPGTSVPVTVTWRALQPSPGHFTAFVHLLDATGRLVAQDDHIPLQGLRPTSRWIQGEIVPDRFDLALPPDLPTGIYRLEIGLYDARQPGLPRLRTPNGADSAVVGEIRVAP